MQTSLSENSKTSVLVLAAGILGPRACLEEGTRKALHESEILVFESDRGARTMLKAAGHLHRDYLVFSEHSEKETLARLASVWHESSASVLYCSDQGLPNIEDPGGSLIDLALKSQVRVRVLPGPSALTMALAACPFLGRQGFVFEGFLPQKKAERELRWAHIASQRQQATAMFETPYRLASLLAECDLHLNTGRRLMFALDLAGEHEYFLYSKAGSVQKDFADVLGLNLKLPAVLVIDGL